MAQFPSFFETNLEPTPSSHTDISFKSVGGHIVEMRLSYSEGFGYILHQNCERKPLTFRILKVY